MAVDANLVVCMAGYNTRFHDSGFDIPKYLLPWKDRTVISSILNELGRFHEIILVANKRDYFFYDKLCNTLSDYDNIRNQILYINDTKGQAETAMIGISRLKVPEIPVFIHNADTIIKNRDLSSVAVALSEHSAYIDVFVSTSPAYSYTIIENGRVTDIREKFQVSPYASSGLYGFKSSTLFQHFFNRLEVDAVDNPIGELYISNLLQLMLSDHQSIFTNQLDNSQETLVLGTPQEYGLEVTKNFLLSQS